MKTEIEAAIKGLTQRVGEATTAQEAMQFTQAALNLAHITRLAGEKRVPVRSTAETHAHGLLASAAFSAAPVRSSWGDGMLVADVALSRDETMAVFIHRNALQLVAGTADAG